MKLHVFGDIVTGNGLVFIGQGFVTRPELDHGGKTQRLSLLEAC
jgi:hypothetical protein